MRQIAPMRRLIREKHTGRFLGEGGVWTQNETEAHNFPSCADAVRACSTYDLKGVELILRFHSKELDAVLPLCD